VVVNAASACRLRYKADYLAVNTRPSGQVEH
jgi:hypothetical protein